MDVGVEENNAHGAGFQLEADVNVRHVVIVVAAGAVVVRHHRQVEDVTLLEGEYLRVERLLVGVRHRDVAQRRVDRRLALLYFHFRF